MQSVGFIGLGIMGLPMVKNLLNAGFEVNIWNRTVEKSDQLSNQGANSCQSPGDVARNSEVIIICVTATSDVEAVLLGSESITDPIINGVEKSNIVIDMSTISPARTREFAIQLNSIGASMLDAPISGGDIGAKNGTLTIMVGGNIKDFDFHSPNYIINSTENKYYINSDRKIKKEKKIILMVLENTPILAVLDIQK